MKTLSIGDVETLLAEEGEGATDDRKELLAIITDLLAQLKVAHEETRKALSRPPEKPVVNVSAAAPAITVQSVGGGKSEQTAWNCEVVKRDKDGRISHIQFHPWSGKK